MEQRKKPEKLTHHHWIGTTAKIGRHDDGNGHVSHENNSLEQ
jgi:hypothetical protein